MGTSELSTQEGRGTNEASRSTLDLRVLGARCGAGLNNIDFALLHYHQTSPSDVLHVEALRYSKIAVAPSFRNSILNLLQSTRYTSSLVSRINVYIGEMFSDGMNTFCERNDIDITSIHFVGAYLAPLGRNRFRSAEKDEHAFDWQSTITSKTSRSTVTSFSFTGRAFVGAQYSPVAFVDRLLLQHTTKFRVCLNINELTQICFIPAAGTEHDTLHTTLSWECGPGSLLIDYAVRYCTSNSHSDDYDGKFAASGRINHSIVDNFLRAHDYLCTAPSLSIAREMFGDHEAQRFIDECLFFNMSDADIVATITRVTAQNILKQYHRLFDHFFPHSQQVDEIFICGPGARNLSIVDYIEAELPERVITKPLDDIGIPGDANNAVCYAHLALETVLRQTTASADSALSNEKQEPDLAVRGRICRGDKWEEVVAQTRRFSEGKTLTATKDIRIAGDFSARET